jgi:hypothetical protein
MFYFGSVIDYLRELNHFEKGYEPFAGPPEII